MTVVEKEFAIQSIFASTTVLQGVLQTTLIQPRCTNGMGRATTSRNIRNGMNHQYNIPDSIASPKDHMFRLDMSVVLFVGKDVSTISPMVNGELEQKLATVDSNGDGWMSVEVTPSFELNGEFDQGDAWAFLRNSYPQG